MTLPAAGVEGGPMMLRTPDVVETGTAARAYWHSRRRLFSVVSGRGPARVTAHVDELWQRDVRFVVRPAGRDRVRRTGKKAPHAFVAGTAADPAYIRLVDESGVEVGYNPARDDAFVARPAGRAIRAAELVALRAVRGRPLVLAWGVRYADD